MPETSFLGESLSALVTNIGKIVRVDVFGVRFESLLGRVLFIALLTLENSKPSVLHFVIRESGLPGEGLWTNFTRETLLAVNFPDVSVHQPGFGELLSAEFANRRLRFALSTFLSILVGEGILVLLFFLGLFRRTFSIFSV